MLEFKTCEYCHRPEICDSRCECTVDILVNEDIAKQRDDAFMQWIADHATDRDINRDGGAE